MVINNEKINFDELVKTLLETESSVEVFIDYEELELVYNKFEEFFKKPKVTIKVISDFFEKEFTDPYTDINFLDAHISNMSMWALLIKSSFNGNNNLNKFVDNIERTKTRRKASFVDMIILSKLSKMYDEVHAEQPKVEEDASLNIDNASGGNSDGNDANASV